MVTALRKSLTANTMRVRMRKKMAVRVTLVVKMEKAKNQTLRAQMYSRMNQMRRKDLSGMSLKGGLLSPTESS